MLIVLSHSSHASLRFALLAVAKALAPVVMTLAPAVLTALSHPLPGLVPEAAASASEANPGAPSPAPLPEPGTSADPAAGITFRIDPLRSSAKFEMPATLHTVIGRTQSVSGQFTRPRAPARDGFPVRGRIVIAAASLDTGNATRDRRMRSESLDVVRHPEIVFIPKRAVGTALSFEPGSTQRFALEGEITIRGVTKPVSLDVTARQAESGLSADGTTTLSFPDFGVPDPSNFFLHVKTTLRISVHVEAGRDPEASTPPPARP